VPLSDHLQPDLSEQRIDRVWSTVRARLDGAPRRRSVWRPVALVGVIGAAALTAVLVFTHGSGTSALENAALQTASDSLAVTLVDGSQLTLDSKTRVQVASSGTRAVTLTLAQGRVSCDVTHMDGRSFTVHASGIQVRVVGTRFSVRDEKNADGEHVDVAVERGAVEVLSERHPGRVTRVSAGQTFSEVVPTPAPAAAANEVAAPSSSAPVAAEGVLPESAPSSPDVAPSASTSGAVVVAQPSARDLLDLANQARREGDARAAADAYAQLLRKFPGDSRAGLAAFELGRLRMDRLNDLPGAAQALERAVALAPGSGFREDATARLVLVYTSLGRSADCERARAQYLAAFPTGLRRSAVERGCQH